MKLKGDEVYKSAAELEAMKVLVFKFEAIHAL